MFIEKKDSIRKLFQDVAIGSIFTYEFGDIYLKISEFNFHDTTDEANDDIFNAVNLTYDTVTYINPNTEVDIVNAKLVVE